MAHRRGPWSQAEDNYLIQLVQTQGALNWVRIANHIGSRSPKQCRERYHQNLKGSLNHEPISPEEGILIERLVSEMGKRWAEIARRLNGRSDNAVKNWWNGSQNRRRRTVLRRRPSSQCHNTFDERTQTLSFPRQTNIRHLALPNTYPPMRSMELPAPSPVFSNESRSASVDRAPSLMSDNGSAFSPIVATPRLELPHPNSFNREMRRPSLPTIHQNGFYSETDSHFQTRFGTETKSHSVTLHPPPRQYECETPSPRDYTYDSRRVPTAPNTSIILPPLKLENTNFPSQRMIRESSMGGSTYQMSRENSSNGSSPYMVRENSQNGSAPQMRSLNDQSNQSSKKDSRMDLSSLLG